jgi:hypothetical protein
MPSDSTGGGGRTVGVRTGSGNKQSLIVQTRQGGRRFVPVKGKNLPRKYQGR